MKHYQEIKHCIIPLSGGLLTGTSDWYSMLKSQASHDSEFCYHDQYTTPIAPRTFVTIFIKTRNKMCHHFGSQYIIPRGKIPQGQPVAYFCTSNSIHNVNLVQRKPMVFCQNLYWKGQSNDRIIYENWVNIDSVVCRQYKPRLDICNINNSFWIFRTELRWSRRNT